MANYRKSFNLRNGVQVDDDNFIVNANGLVGIGTSVPTEFLDVRGNAKVVGLTTTNTLYAGIATVGVLTVTQGVIVTGVVTATSFSGSASGLTDIYAIAVDGWYVTSGSISTTSNVGIGTTLPQGKLQIGTAITFSSNGNATYSGIVTALSFSGSGVELTALPSGQLTGTIDNARLPSNINVSGVVTATSGFVGNVTGIASTARDIVSTANITVNSINSGFSTTGVSTAFTSAYVGTSGTAFAALNSGRVGIGTALPTSELQIRKASASLLEVLSDTDQARVSIGQSVGVGRSTAVLRFGDTAKTFDIINNDTGNINLYLHAGPSGVGTGRFDWLYGQTNAQLMSLTYGGRLGLGKTNPDETLHVVGTSTVTSSAWFGGDVTVSGTLRAGSLDITSFTGTLLGNVYTTTGISTFNILNTKDIIVSAASSIGIGQASPIVDLDARNKRGLFGSIGIFTDVFYGTEVVALGGNVVSPSGGVGIGTTAVNPFGGGVQLYNRRLDFYNSTLSLDNISKIGFNTTTPRAVFDYGSVGSATTRPVMVVPNISNSTRNGIGQTPAGSMIFNTDTLKFQGYTGVGWTDFN